MGSIRFHGRGIDELTPCLFSDALGEGGETARYASVVKLAAPHRPCFFGLGELSSATWTTREAA